MCPLGLSPLLKKLLAGLYLHIPFCTQRCVYCDFYFVTTRKSHASFVQALCAELEHYAYTHGTLEPIETIYFGGGTPSLLHPDALYQILQTIHDGFDTANVQEVTLELNPEDATLDDLRTLRTMGFDRLSIGIQSFFEDDLRWMNRSHDAAHAEAIVPLARQAGFDNFSVDLIFGVPDQPMEYWMANVQKAAAMEVPHLSTYSLTVEERTPLFKQVQRGLVTTSDDETTAQRYQFTMDYLREQGYAHYEISSFARSGFRAVHNQRYWEHANYLGVGPSAHAFWWKKLPVSRADRWANVRNLRLYESLLDEHQMPLEYRERLDYDTLANEYILLRLRTADGLDLDVMENTYGVDLLMEKVDAIAELERADLLTLRNDTLTLTDAGKHVCDAVTAKLLVE